jgi:hypothetical protein
MNTLVTNAVDIATNVAGINTVANDLDHEVEVMELKLNQTEAELTGDINHLAQVVNLGDVNLQNQVNTLNRDLDDTNANLADEVAAGIVRDGRLNGHDADVVTINADIATVDQRLTDTTVILVADLERLDGKLD